MNRWGLFLSKICFQLKLKQIFSLFFRRQGRKIGRCNIKYSLCTCDALLCHLVSRSCISSNYAGSKFGVGAQLQRIFNHLLGICAGCACADNKAAVRDTAVVAIQLLLRNEVMS